MTDEAFALLLERYLEGTLDAPGRAALAEAVRDTPRYQELFASQARLHLQLNASLREDHPDDARRRLEMIRSICSETSEREVQHAVQQRLGIRQSHSRRRRAVRILAAGVLAASVLALGIHGLLFRKAEPARARLEQVQGEVYVLAQDARLPAQAGQELVSGQGLQIVGDDSLAVVVLPDTTRLELGSGTLFTEPSGPDPASSRKIVLAGESALVANVAKQPAEQPLILATPHAEVAVQESRLSLANTTSWTHLELEEGASVQLTRKRDGRSVEVQTGHGAVVTSDAQPMVIQPLAPRLTAARTISRAHGGGVPTLLFTPDGRALVTGSSDRTVKLWEVATGEERITLPEHAGPVRALAFFPDGQMLAAGAGIGAIRLWRLAGEPVGTTLPGPRDEVQGSGEILALALSPDGRSLTLAGKDGSVYRWGSVSGEEPPVLVGRTGNPLCAALFLEGQLLATGRPHNVVKLWDLTSGQVRGILQPQEGQSQTASITALAFAPDGRTLASGSSDGTVRLWGVATGQVRTTLHGHTNKVLRAVFSPDGRTLATGSRDRTARLWNVAEGRERATLQGHQQGVGAVAFSPDGSTLATGGVDRSVRFWEVPVD